MLIGQITRVFYVLMDGKLFYDEAMLLTADPLRAYRFQDSRSANRFLMEELPGRCGSVAELIIETTVKSNPFIPADPL